MLASRLKKILFSKSVVIIANFALIVTLGFIVFRNWIFTSEWPGGGDVLGWISRSYLWRDFRWLYVWRNSSFGFVEGVALDFKDLSLMLVYSLINDAPTTVKVFMFFGFLTAGFSIYAFTYRYTRHSLGAFSASLIYMLNPWFFSQFTEAHADVVFSYALAPLVFLLLDRALKTGKLKDVLATALGFWLVLASFHVQYTVIYGFFLGLFVVFYVIAQRKSSVFQRIKRSFRVIFPACLIASCLSAFFLVSFASTAVPAYLSPGYGYPLESSFWTSYNNVIDAFTLRGNEQWGYTSKVNTYTGISLPDFPISEFLLLLFLITYVSVLVFIRLDRYTTFFALSALISIFMSKGPNPPFGYVFIWGWFNLPYFSVLRAASRWGAMTAFSSAFFISILTSRLTNYVLKKKADTSDRFIRVVVRTPESGQAKEVFVSSISMNSLISRVHKFARFLGVVLFVCIFMSSFLASWFFFSQGLQVYTPPREYLEPLEWIGRQSGDYKVVTVGSSPYLGDGAMKTDLGNGHDIGYDSYFIHDKPTLQNGGLDPRAQAFVDNLQYWVVPQHLTDDASKMIGVFNYRYTVIPSYADNGTRDFFVNQKGTRIAFNQSSLVLESDYNPSLFAAKGHAIVIGGLESLYSLMTIDSFNLNETALIFADQILPNGQGSKASLDTANSLIFVDSDPIDLLMMSIKDKAYWSNAGGYGVNSFDQTAYWIRSTDWRNKGKLVLGGSTLRTSGSNNLDVPLQVGTRGVYDVWLRLGFGPSQGTLGLFIDGDYVGEVKSTQSLESMKWVKISSLELDEGSHSIGLKSKGDGLVDIDIITIVDSSTFDSEFEAMRNMIRQFSGRLIYYLQAEDLFAYELPDDWFTLSTPYDGVALSTEGVGRNIAPEGSASASSTQAPAQLFDPKNTIDGDLNTRWASTVGMPQWLKAEWDIPREITGVKILFENALAEDYSVQSWNGTQWVTQIEVEGNNETERVHRFDQAVETTKIRIYVTKASAFDLVSIWELECYSPRGVSQPTSNINILTSGRYMIGLRLASGPDQGLLELDLSNFSTTISCFSNNSGFNWYEIGPYSLTAGNHTVSLLASGKVTVQAIVLYSLFDNESTLPLQALFSYEETSTSVDYYAVNPCRYNVHVKSAKPLFLVFSETYHPLWKIYVDSLEAPHTITYSFLNGYFINKTGESDLVLCFEGQTYGDIGIGITTVTFCAIAVYPISQSKLLKSFIRKRRWIKA